MNDKGICELIEAVASALTATGEMLEVLGQELKGKSVTISREHRKIEWLSIPKACSRHGGIEAYNLRRGLEKKRWPLTEGVHYSVVQGGKTRRFTVAYPLIFEAIERNT